MHSFTLNWRSQLRDPPLFWAKWKVVLTQWDSWSPVCRHKKEWAFPQEFISRSPSFLVYLLTCGTCHDCHVPCVMDTAWSHHYLPRLCDEKELRNLYKSQSKFQLRSLKMLLMDPMRRCFRICCLPKLSCAMAC